jgi:hypothetical protein
MRVIRPVNETEKYANLYTELVAKLKELGYAGNKTNFDEVHLFLQQHMGLPYQ